MAYLPSGDMYLMLTAEISKLKVLFVFDKYRQHVINASCANALPELVIYQI